jgi:hypothetical protein
MVDWSDADSSLDGLDLTCQEDGSWFDKVRTTKCWSLSSFQPDFDLRMWSIPYQCQDVLQQNLDVFQRLTAHKIVPGTC